MYACIHETAGGFIGEVCAPRNATVYLRDPPLPPALANDSVLAHGVFLCSPYSPERVEGEFSEVHIQHYA
jgi:hypothetical protein